VTCVILPWKDANEQDEVEQDKIELDCLNPI